MVKKLAVICALLSFNGLFGSDKLNLENDKTYILDFFASWCSSCEKELPILSKKYEQLKGENIELIGIDVDKNEKDGKKFQEKMATHLNFKVINDTTNEIINSYKPLGIPAIYIVKNNQVCGKLFGAVSNFEEKLDEQLKLCKGKK